MSLEESLFGTLPSSEPVRCFTLTNANGCRVRILNYGGIITSLETPDRNGNLADIVLGKDRLEDYLAGHPYFGAIVGRVSGRIGGASFALDGQNYTLAQNNGPNCLHGGAEGFDKMLWAAQISDSTADPKLELRLHDPDGHNNFPGAVDCAVTYALREDNSLEIRYRAEATQATPFNLTNHSYFNLNGHDSGDVLDHEVAITADTVAPVDADGTLLGCSEPVRAGYNDYRQPVALRDRPKLDMGNADIFFMHAKGRTHAPKLIARVYAPTSGRSMEVSTTEPGVQFYAGLALSCDGPESGKNGSTYPPLSGLCLETQDYADSVNFPEMGGALLQPGEVFHSVTVYRFAVQD